MSDHQFSAEWCTAAAQRITYLEQRLAAAEAEIARWQKLMEPQWYWDDRDLDAAVPADEVGNYDDVGDIIKLRPLVELPYRYAIVTKEGVKFYDSEEAAKAGGV